MKALILYMTLCLVLTVLLEEGTAFLLSVRGRDNVINIFLINLITNLPLTIGTAAAAIFSGIPYLAAAMIGEILVFAAETVLYGKYLTGLKMNAAVFSLIMNLASLVIGGGVLLCLI